MPDHEDRGCAGVYFIATLLCAAGGLAVLPAYGEDQSTSAVTQPAAAKDSVVALIRTKLADPALRKGADPADLAALEAVYKARTGGPLWMTDMGFSAKGERALSEISEADDWGLDASAFDLPSGNDLPAGPEAAAIAELKLDLAILKYARFARGGRLTPLDIDDKLCATPVTYVVIWSPGGGELGINVYSGSKAPTGTGDLCASYFYQTP